jgi:hypothetical protein
MIDDVTFEDVFNFKRYDVGSGGEIVSLHKWTREGIKLVGGTIQPETRQRVSTRFIDEQYRYIPKWEVQFAHVGQIIVEHPEGHRAAFTIVKDDAGKRRLSDGGNWTEGPGNNHNVDELQVAGRAAALQEGLERGLLDR